MRHFWISQEKPETFDCQELDTFLAELKKGGLFTATLKAIVTPHNIFWDSQMLYQELSSERASLS